MKSIFKDSYLVFKFDELGNSHNETKKLQSLPPTASASYQKERLECTIDLSENDEQQRRIELATIKDSFFDKMKMLNKAEFHPAIDNMKGQFDQLFMNLTLEEQETAIKGLKITNELIDKYKNTDLDLSALSSKIETELSIKLGVFDIHKEVIDKIIISLALAGCLLIMAGAFIEAPALAGGLCLAGIAAFLLTLVVSTASPRNGSTITHLPYPEIIRKEKKKIELYGRLQAVIDETVTDKDMHSLFMGFNTLLQQNYFGKTNFNLESFIKKLDNFIEKNDFLEDNKIENNELKLIIAFLEKEANPQ